MELEIELDLYQEKGIFLYLEGQPSSPRTIARACQIAEDGAYMRDYTEDESGQISRVDFEFIPSTGKEEE